MRPPPDLQEWIVNRRMNKTGVGDDDPGAVAGHAAAGAAGGTRSGRSVLNLGSFEQGGPVAPTDRGISIRWPAAALCRGNGESRRPRAIYSA